MRFIFTLFFFISNFLEFAPKNEVIIEFVPTFNNLPLKLDKIYNFKNDSLKISVLKFYISNITFLKDDKLVDAVSNKYFLIDIENPENLSIKFLRTNSKKFNKISFSIGVDSLANVSGAFGEDLDPTNGMYWTWQSGYINFKLEGRSNICPSRNNSFNFHVGGYQYPYNSLQTLVFSVKESKKFVFNLDIYKLLNEIKLNENFEVMSPSKKALTIAQQFSKAFKVIE